jgi:acetate kinase
MNVLVLNVGSSTLKFELIGTDAARIEANDDARLAGGAVERIGGEAVMSLSVRGAPPIRAVAPLRNLAAAVEHVSAWLVSDDAKVGISSLAEIEAVGHRVVHGGEQFKGSQRVDDKVLAALDELVDLAPLHNPHNVAGMRAATRVFGPGVPQVAVFDTAFHTTLPETAFLYGLPYQLYRRYRVRRYGFHGTSHRYVAHRYRQITGRPREGSSLITLHLGNGASACAIRGGDSIDTSMGFTPLEGLVMGTRSGDLDPAILDFIAGKEGLTLPQIEVMLNKQSGLLGLSGLTPDMRELLQEIAEHDDRRARLAVDVFCYRVRKYIGAYLAVLNGADAIIFAGGIGENAVEIRARVCANLESLGVRVDADANRSLTGGREGRFDAEGSRIELWVIPTDEELLIARDTWRVVTGAPLRY